MRVGDLVKLIDNEIDEISQNKEIGIIVEMDQRSRRVTVLWQNGEEITNPEYWLEEVNVL